MGHIPRSMSVHCRGELTRLASPGDVVTIDGVFLPQRVAEGGYRAMKVRTLCMHLIALFAYHLPSYHRQAWLA